jgi:hypothetical protein
VTPAPAAPARRREDDEIRARDQLIVDNLPLARRDAHSAQDSEDLTQVASLGLVKAADRYDESRGTSFTSFAVPTIVGELKRRSRPTGVLGAPGDPLHSRSGVSRLSAPEPISHPAAFARCRGGQPTLNERQGAHYVSDRR